MSYRLLPAILVFLLISPPAPVEAEVQVIDMSAPGILRSASRGDLTSKALGDTFPLYGGPGSLEGTFQDESGLPDSQGWTSVDLSEVGSAWHASQVNVENLGAGSGNWGAICRHDDTDYTGYGNSWDMQLLLRLDPTILDPGFDPATDTSSVRLLFDFNHALETGFDYFQVQWNQAGVWQTADAFTGTNWMGSGWTPQSYDSLGDIAYAGGEYLNGEIFLRLRVASDGGHSDEDGIFPTFGRGAAAVDDIEVWLDGNLVSLADWEPMPVKLEDLPEGEISGHDNGAGPGTAGWQPVPSTMAGDFARIFSGFSDIDECRDNLSPQFGFIDDGTPPNNDPEGRSTGGSLSSKWNYGVPGGWVVNRTGGIGGAWPVLTNEIWSPPIDWDLPGTEDDTAIGGAILSFDWWAHLAISDGIFAVWHVRLYDDATEWGEWRDHGFLYFSSQPRYLSWSVDVSDLIDTQPDQVQLALGVYDLADLFGFPGTDSTPSPLFDNVALAKYDLGGPIITARERNLFQDSFPNSGSVDMASPGDLAIRLDMARDRSNVYNVIVPGDSIVAEVVATLPGTTLSSVSMGWALAANPAFDAVRTLPIDAISAGSTGPRWGERDLWFGSVEGQPITVHGIVLADKYSFDLPDGPAHPDATHQIAEPAMFFPGDVLHYFIRAEDDQGNVSTLPGDISGLLEFSWQLGTAPRSYDPMFTVRGLPSLDASGFSPDLLLWYDGSFGEIREDVMDAFAENCLAHGGHMDVYNTMAASSGVSNGLGSAGSHGASPEQLAGYKGILYISGRLNSRLLSDGNDDGGNDKSDDIGLMSAWHGQDDWRFHAYFGDDFGEGMSSGSAQSDYLRDVLGSVYNSSDVSVLVEDQKAPVMDLTAQSVCLGTPLQVYGDCPQIRDFDDIRPGLAGAVASHEYLDIFGIPYVPEVPAGVEWVRQEGGKNKHTQVFGFNLDAVRWPPSGPSGFGSAAAAQLRSVLYCGGFGITIVGKTFCGPSDVPELDPVLRFGVDQNWPNPFNPVTAIRLTAPRDGDLSLRIYNVRGELIRTIHDGFLGAGEHVMEWDGRDAKGHRVSSGVYLYRVVGFGHSETRKMALVK